MGPLEPKGVFARILIELAREGDKTDVLMIDATHLKAHRTASNLPLKRGGKGRLIGLTKGGLNSKLHAVTDALGRTIRLFLTAGNVNDYIGARALMSSLPKAKWLLADRGYDADWFRNGLKGMKIESCIPSRRSRKKVIPHDKIRYKARHKIENMFGKLRLAVHRNAHSMSQDSAINILVRISVDSTRELNNPVCLSMKVRARFVAVSTATPPGERRR